MWGVNQRSTSPRLHEGRKNLDYIKLIILTVFGDEKVGKKTLKFASMLFVYNVGPSVQLSILKVIIWSFISATSAFYHGT